jgi:hypothetical protein
MGNVRKSKATARPKPPEDRAREFLLSNPIRGYRFTEKRTGDGDGFDIWCCRTGGKRFKVEIKATDMPYVRSRQSDIRKQLYFSRMHEISLFQAGELKVVRVFLGGLAPAVLMFDISIQRGRKLKREPRAYLTGSLDYGKVQHLL